MNPTPNQITECDDEKQLCEWNPMKTAPTNGESVLLKIGKSEAQASFHGGKWCEEREWKKHELSMPDRKLNPTGWKPL